MFVVFQIGLTRNEMRRAVRQDRLEATRDMGNTPGACVDIAAVALVDRFFGRVCRACDGIRLH
jgi:hypothetical protein